LDKPAEAAVAAPHGSNCNTLACRWKAFIAHHLAAAKGFRKGCGGRMRHGQHKGAVAAPKPDGAQRVYDHHHTWKQLFKNITSYILLPVLIGIVAGVSLSM
jgi:hypothetical protein